MNEKIGIRNVAKIGIADIDVYNANRKKFEEIIPKNAVNARIQVGVFFDGTGNNADNSDMVYYYHKDKFRDNFPIDTTDVPKYKHKGFKVKSDSSYWNSYSNVRLLHDIYEERVFDDNKKESKDPHYYIQLRVYVQGIGTLKDFEDDQEGTGFGEGDRGVIARVEQACLDIADKIKIQFDSYKKPLYIESLQFDVFGFSRGAAAARHFCNEVLKEKSISKEIRIEKEKFKVNDKLKKETYYVEVDNTRVNKQIPKSVFAIEKVFTGGKLGELLKANKILYPKNKVTIEFLGLFDTVISQMLEIYKVINISRKLPPIIPNILPFGPRLITNPTNKFAIIKKVNPDVSNKNIKNVFHLFATKEWRENFPITPISNYYKGYSLGVMGSHSDIGGGYWQTKQEIATLHFFDIDLDDYTQEINAATLFMNQLRNWYIEKGYCNNDTSEIEWEIWHHVKITNIIYIDTITNTYTYTGKSKHVLIKKDVLKNETVKVIDLKEYELTGYHYVLKSVRKIDNKLSLVYMNVMKHIATNFGKVPFLLKTEGATHPEEYKFNKGFSLQEYQNYMITIAEKGWQIKNNGEKDNGNLFFKENGKDVYKIESKTYKNVIKNFVHLSGNFNIIIPSPYLEKIADLPYFEKITEIKSLFPHAPRMMMKDKFVNPPYERASYIPKLEEYDKK